MAFRRIAVTGWAGCPYHERALQAAKDYLSEHSDARIANLDEQTFDSRDEYRAWLFSPAGRATVADNPRAAQHSSSPFITVVG